jgi:hypothetical protein
MEMVMALCLMEMVVVLMEMKMVLVWVATDFPGVVP